MSARDVFILDSIADYLGGAEEPDGTDVCNYVIAMIAMTGRPDPRMDPDDYCWQARTYHDGRDLRKKALQRLANAYMDVVDPNDLSTETVRAAEYIEALEVALYEVGGVR